MACRDFAFARPLGRVRFANQKNPAKRANCADPDRRSNQHSGPSALGHWNACPPPAYHVAALRKWHDRYGAELLGIDGDTLNLRVWRKPATHEEALELARVQHV